MTGFSLNTISFEMSVNAAGDPVSVQLNGNALATGQNGTSTYAFVNGAISASILNAGINTLDFVVTKGEAGPAGLEVTFPEQPTGTPLAQPDFDLTVTPAVQSVAIGSTASFTVSAIGASGVNGPVYLSATWTPVSNSCCLTGASNDSLALSTGSIASNGSATLSFTPNGRDLATSYQITITGNANGVTRSATITVAVTDPESELTPFALFGTGLASQNVLIAEDAVDPHYHLISAPAGAYQGPSALGLGTNDASDSQGLPGGWANNYGAKWIGPLSTATIADAPAGAYRYRTTFDLTGFDSTTAYVSGSYYAADQCEIFLNGQSVVLSGNPQFASSAGFVLSAGFQPGVNTLDFVVTKAPAGPTGLMVQILEAEGVKTGQ